MYIFTVALSPADKTRIIDYINNRKKKHGVTSFDDKLKGLYENAQLVHNERDMTD